MDDSQQSFKRGSGHRMFIWSSLFDSLPDWSIWTHQQQLYLSHVKALSVLDQDRIDSQLKDLLLVRPVPQAPFVNQAALSAAANTVLRQQWNDAEATYDRNLRQFKEDAKLEREIHDLHATALNCYADSFATDSVVMVQRQSIIHRSEIAFRASLKPFNDAGITPADALMREAANLPADQAVIAQFAPHLVTWAAARDGISPLARFRAMESYLKTEFKPGHPTQQAMLIGMLQELRDTYGSIFDVNIKFYHLVELIGISSGTEFTEIQLQLYFKRIFTDNRFDSILSDMQYESTRPIPAEGRRFTVAYCWDRILTECRLDPKKDIYASTKRPSVKPIISRQVLLSAQEDHPAQKKVRFNPPQQGGDHGVGRGNSGGAFGGRGGRNGGGRNQKQHYGSGDQAPPHWSTIQPTASWSNLPPQQMNYSNGWYPPQFRHLQYAFDFDPATSVCFRCGQVGHPAIACTAYSCVNCGANLHGGVYHDAKTCTGSSTPRVQNQGGGRYGPSSNGRGNNGRGRGGRGPGGGRGSGRGRG